MLEATKKIKPLGWQSWLAVVTLAIGSVGFSLPVSGQAEILGDCSGQACAELLTQLRQQWRQETQKFEGKCANGQLGLDIWQNRNGQNSKVALLCWGEEDANGLKTGDFLGVLPFPGEEASFPSPLTCNSGDRNCEEILARIKAKAPDEVEKYEFECAVMRGELNLSISELTSQAQCIFPTSIYIDENGDGKPDYEQGIMHLVDVILGSFPLSEL